MDASAISAGAGKAPWLSRRRALRHRRAHDDAAARKRRVAHENVDRPKLPCGAFGDLPTRLSLEDVADDEQLGIRLRAVEEAMRVAGARGEARAHARRQQLLAGVPPAERLAIFLDRLRNRFIVSKSAGDKYGDQWFEHPIGTGPYKLVEYKPNEFIRVAKNPDYWKKGLPYLDAIEYRIVTSLSTRTLSFVTGQVDITSGKFVFSAAEAYMIEDGKITYPVKGATLIGNGPDVLTRVSMIGNDMALDSGVGTCGKEGQSVPVGVGQPTLRIDGLTVGGTV